MRAIDEIHLEYPAKGVIGMTDALREMNFNIGERHTRTMMRKMGVEERIYVPYSNNRRLQ